MFPSVRIRALIIPCLAAAVTLGSAGCDKGQDDPLLAVVGDAEQVQPLVSDQVVDHGVAADHRVNSLGRRLDEDRQEVPVELPLPHIVFQVAERDFRLDLVAVLERVCLAAGLARGGAGRSTRAPGRSSAPCRA